MSSLLLGHFRIKLGALIFDFPQKPFNFFLLVVSVSQELVSDLVKFDIE